ncbi:MAG: HAMP domain-containing sensor histidine kinase [Cyanobacteria bacterium J06648_16]
MNVGQVLATKKDDVVRSWISQVRQDEVLESTQELTYKGILDSLPGLIDAIAHLLSHPDTEGIEEIVLKAVDHGELRAEQGYDAEEIVREYAILRDVVFEQLEERLLESKPLTLLRTTRLIDGTIDKVVAVCLKHYTEGRLQEINLLYDEMMASNQELDRLVRNEQSNLAYLAHELKTPLTCIIGYSDLFLRKQQGENGELKLNFIEQVLSSGRQLLTTINDTLEMSSYQAGQVPVNLTTVDVCEVVRETTGGLRTMAQQKGLSVVLDCPTEAAQLTTDRGRLRQVMTNLISNAVRYTEQGSIRVSVQVLSEDHELRVAITDTGYGIDAADQSRIFEPYYQGKAGQQLPSSTGLGLAIASQMIKLLQGRILVQSKPGEGSTFTIVLPLKYELKQT